MEKDNRANRYSPETRARAERMVLDNQGNHESQLAAIKAIAPKIGCGRDTLRRWVQQEETDAGCRDGVTSEERARIKNLEREVRELRQANAILKKASAYFAPSRDLAPQGPSGQRDGARPPTETMIAFIHCPAVDTQYR